MRAHIPSPPTRATIKVSIVENDELVRRGVSEMLLDTDDLMIVGESAMPFEALRKIPIERPDVVLVDVNLGGLSGIELCREIRVTYASVRVLMLTSHVDHDAVLAFVLAGASGFAMKQIRNQALVEAVRDVASGKLLLPRADRQEHELGLPSKPDGALAGLSPQERRVLDGVVEGLTPRQIGARLGIPEKSVRDRVSSLIEKLEVEHHTQRTRSGTRLARAHAHRVGHHGDSL